MYVSETVHALLSQCVPITACGESLQGGLVETTVWLEGRRLMQ